MINKINKSGVLPLNTYFETYDEYEIDVVESYSNKLKEVIDKENIVFVHGIELRGKRSAQSEEAFGIIKQQFQKNNKVYLNKVNLEFYLAIIGFNLAKYHNCEHRLNYQP